MVFDQALAAIHEALGDACTFTPEGAADSVPIKAVLSARPGDVLGGDQISTHYEVRVASSAVGGAVMRGSLFVFSGVTYKATASGQPLVDQAELLVPVKRV